MRRENQLKKGGLLLAISGIAVLFVILYMARATFSASKENLEQETVAILRSLYEEQVQSFIPTSNNSLTHSVTLELNEIGRNVVTHLTGKDCEGIRNIHILDTVKSEEAVTVDEIEISTDGTLVYEDIIQHEELRKRLPIIFDDHSESLRTNLSQLKEAYATIQIEENGKIIRHLQYDNYTAVLSTQKKGKQTELEFQTVLNGVMYTIQGTGTISGKKLSGSFTLTTTEGPLETLHFEIEQLDLKKWKQGYLKGTLIIPTQETTVHDKTDVWNELSGYPWNETEWIFSMNSDKNERRIKLTAIIEKEVAIAVSVVTEVKEISSK